MRASVFILAGALLGGFAAFAQADDSWTPVPNCGAKPPAATDVSTNTALWQCAKAQFRKSQVDYAAAQKAFASRIPPREQSEFLVRVQDWKAADGRRCTKENSLDFGCAVAAGYTRAQNLKDAIARCDAGDCHVDELP